MKNQLQFAQTQTAPLNSVTTDNIESCAPIFEQFENAVRSDYRWFFGFALRVAKNHHDAEDAVQDAFLAAYQHLGELKSTDKLNSWIASIVLNRARMQYRVKNRYAFSLDEELNGKAETRFVEVQRDPSASPEDHYAMMERYAQLLSLLASLSAKLRQTFLLRRVAGLNTAETAEALGITPRLVRVRLSRASSDLEKLLKRHVDGARSRASLRAKVKRALCHPSAAPVSRSQVTSAEFNSAMSFMAAKTWSQTPSMEYQ